MTIVEFFSILLEKLAISKEAKKISYITAAERIGMEKGVAQSVFATHHAIAAIIDLKFGKSGRRLSTRAHQIDNPKTLQKLTTKLKRAQNLAQAEMILAEMEKGNGKRLH